VSGGGCCKVGPICEVAVATTAAATVVAAAAELTGSWKGGKGRKVKKKKYFDEFSLPESEKKKINKNK
jgi:hypothetical protein